MKIAHIVESFGAGTFHSVRSIVNACSGLGWTSAIFYGLRAETPKDFPAYFDPQVTFRQLPTGRMPNPVSDALAVAQIVELVRRERVDVLHGHSAKGGGLARIAGVIANVPTLYTPHGFPFLSEAGVKRLSATYLLEKMLSSFPSEIVCCSQSEANVAADFGSRVTVIPNSIEVKEIERARSNRPEQKFDVVSLGRMTDQKNPSLFLSIARKFPGNEFVWVGGPREYIRTDVPPNVTITGWINRNKALEYIANSRVFLSTSKFEGMPIAMLEAKALGLPIVSTNVSGSRDVVRHGKDGFLENDEEAIVERLQLLFSSDKVRDIFSISSMSDARDNYDSSVVNAKWVDLYSKFECKSSGGYAGPANAERLLA